MGDCGSGSVSRAWGLRVSVTALGSSGGSVRAALRAGRIPPPGAGAGASAAHGPSGGEPEGGGDAARTVTA